MEESDVIRLLMARRDNYGITSIKHVRGRLYNVRMDGKDYNAVVLASSFMFYNYRYHVCQNVPELVICYDHDTVLATMCLSLERSNLAQPYELPATIVDLKKQRKGKTGSQVLVGMLLCGMRNALDMVDALPETTRKRYLSKIEKLNKRTRGRPVGKEKEKEKAGK
jgi:hypothetical protein